jgi:hypothetical protein
LWYFGELPITLINTKTHCTAATDLTDALQPQ